jgi:hypothetical protein
VHDASRSTAEAVRRDRCRPRRQGSHPVVEREVPGRDGAAAMRRRPWSPAPALRVGRDLHPGRQPACRVALMRTAACLALSSLVACASLGKKSTQPDLKPWPEIRPDVRVETLRARMYEYSITFAAEVDLAATAIERRAADSTVRRNALLWKVRAIPEMRKACFRLEPVSALIDAWIFARQMDQLFSDGAGAGAFGTFQPEAVEVSRRLVDQMREIGGSIAVSPEARAEFEHRVIDPWLAEHPLRDITFVRESPIARFAEQSRARGDTLQSVGTMEDLALSLSQQARIYLADLPRQVRGELDLMRTDMLPAEGLATMQEDLHVSAAAVDRIASTAEGFSSLVPNERQVVLDEMSRQRALVMDAISVERERAVGTIVRAFAEERSELLRDLESQRLATLKWGTAERREALAEVRRELVQSIEALRGERAVVVDDVRHIVDVVLLRVALFLVAAVLLAPLVAHAYARVWPRRWREPQT